MASVLLGEASMGKDAVTLLIAAERSAESMVRSIEAGAADPLELPAFAS